MDKSLIGSFQVKQVGDPANRVLEFMGTDETPDRYGDIVKADGWKFDDYKKNPVFLWGHDYYKVPIGKCLNISQATGSTGTMFQIKFPTIEELCSDPAFPSEEAQFADTVYMAFKNGYLNAVSVGFKALESEERDDQKDLPSWQRGRIFTSQSLLELSACSIPANPNALIQARSQKAMAPDQIKRLEVLLKGQAPEEDTVKAEDVQKMIGEATAALTVEIETLKAMSAVSVNKAGAKFSAASKAAISKALADMQTCVDGYETHSKALMSAMGCIKGLMDGDGSEPDGQSPSETEPNTGADGNVPPAGKSVGDFIDLDTFVLK
jgi:HK97 family phage prohead protease